MGGTSAISPRSRRWIASGGRIQRWSSISPPSTVTAPGGAGPTKNQVLKRRGASAGGHQRDRRTSWSTSSSRSASSRGLAGRRPARRGLLVARAGPGRRPRGRPGRRGTPTCRRRSRDRRCAAASGSRGRPRRPAAGRSSPRARPHPAPTSGSCRQSTAPRRPRKLGPAGAGRPVRGRAARLRPVTRSAGRRARRASRRAARPRPGRPPCRSRRPPR